MDNQRFFLYIALAFVLYMIWLTWQKDHEPPQLAQLTNERTEIVDAVPSSGSEDLPEPDILAQKIVDDLQMGLDQFTVIAGS